MACFKASDSAINVICAPWFDMCTVWFVASRNILVNVLPTCAISAYNHLNLRLGDYKPDIALIAYD